MLSEIASDQVSATKAKTPTRIQAVSRAALLLKTVASNVTDNTVTGLAAETGLAVPTSHHLLGTLCAEGLLSRDQHGRYILGPSVALLAKSMDRDLSPAAPLINSLSVLNKTTSETCYLALWRGGGVHIAATVPGSQPVQVGVPSLPYKDTPARATGRVFLAHMPSSARDAYLAEHPLRKLTSKTITGRRKFLKELDSIQRRGYAIDEEEFQDGVCCVSAAVVVDETAVAALSVSVPRQRWEQRSEELIRLTTSAAAGAASGLLDGKASQERS